MDSEDEKEVLYVKFEIDKKCCLCSQKKVTMCVDTGGVGDVREYYVCLECIPTLYKKAEAQLKKKTTIEVSLFR